MRNLIIITTLIASLLAACSSSETAYPNPSYPNPQGSNNHLPEPADANLSRGAAYVDSAELLTMESFPLQFSLHLKGTLPTPCHKLRISANPPDPENKIHIDVYSVVDPNVVCAQVLEPFDVNYALGSYATGHYILFVNETQVAGFDA